MSDVSYSNLHPICKIVHLFSLPLSQIEEFSHYNIISNNSTMHILKPVQDYMKDNLRTLILYHILCG